jgi:hypothetical protein
MIITMNDWDKLDWTFQAASETLFFLKSYCQYKLLWRDKIHRKSFTIYLCWLFGRVGMRVFEYRLKLPFWRPLAHLIIKSQLHYYFYPSIDNF